MGGYSEFKRMMEMFSDPDSGPTMKTVIGTMIVCAAYGFYEEYKEIIHRKVHEFITEIHAA